MAAADLVDVCFWAPGVPAYYQIEAHFEQTEADREQRAETSPFAYRQWLAIKQLQVRGTDFLWEKEMWIWKGNYDSASADSMPTVADDPNRIWLTDTVVIADDDVLPTSAQPWGFVLDSVEKLGQLQEAARHPAMAFAYIPSGVGPVDPRPFAPNLIYLQGLAGGEQMADWADAVVVRNDSRDTGLACPQVALVTAETGEVNQLVLRDC